MATDSNEASSNMASKMDTEKSVEELAEMKMEFGRGSFAKKQYHQALKSFSEAIELNPNNPQFYGHRAACYMEFEQYQQGLSDSKKMLELNPNSELSIKGYEIFVKCSMHLGELAMAEGAIGKLLELDPNNETANSFTKPLEYVKKHASRAEIEFAAKEFRKVIFRMNCCLSVSTRSKAFTLMKANCLLRLGRYQEASDFAVTILFCDLQNVDALYIRGICFYLLTGNLDQTLTLFRKILRLAPDYSKALDIYKKAKNLKKLMDDGNEALEKQQLAKAYELYTEALTVDNENKVINAELHYKKAVAAAELGRLQESVTECNKSLELKTDYVKALVRRAMSYMLLTEYENAVKDLEKVCELDSSRQHKVLLFKAKQALADSKKKDYYKILGISRNTSTDDIKKAYKKSAMVHHPDRHANASEGEKKEQEKKFKDILEAYTILSDPMKRMLYDSKHDNQLKGAYQDVFGHQNGFFQFHPTSFGSGSFSFNM